MIIFFVLALFLPSATLPQTLTLPRAQTTGRMQRPLLKAGAQSIIASERTRDAIYSKLLPQLAVSHTSTLSKELSLNTTAHTIALSGSQILFHPAGPQLQGRIADLTTQQTQFSFTASRNDTRYQIAKTFLQTWLLQEKKPYIQTLMLYALFSKQKNKRLLLLQSINPAIWAQQEVASTNALTLCASYAAELHSLRQSLASLIGISISALPPKLTCAVDAHTNTLKPLAHYIDLAYAHRPDIKIKKVTEEQYELNAQSSRLSYVPTISATGTVSKTFAGAFDEIGNNASLGIALQWNFFDGFGNVRTAQAHDALKLKTSFERQELKNAIATDITTTYNALKNGMLVLQSTQAQLRAEKALLTQIALSYSQGSVDFVTYLKQASSYLETAHSVRAQTISIESNWQTLAYYCGYPKTGVLHEV